MKLDRAIFKGIRDFINMKLPPLTLSQKRKRPSGRHAILLDESRTARPVSIMISAKGIEQQELRPVVRSGVVTGRVKQDSDSTWRPIIDSVL